MLVHSFILKFSDYCNLCIIGMLNMDYLLNVEKTQIKAVRLMNNCKSEENPINHTKYRLLGLSPKKNGVKIA